MKRWMKECLKVQTFPILHSLFLIPDAFLISVICCRYKRNATHVARPKIVLLVVSQMIRLYDRSYIHIHMRTHSRTHSERRINVLPSYTFSFPFRRANACGPATAINLPARMSAKESASVAKLRREPKRRYASEWESRIVCTCVQVVLRFGTWSQSPKGTLGDVTHWDSASAKKKINPLNEPAANRTWG